MKKTIFAIIALLLIIMIFIIQTIDRQGNPSPPSITIAGQYGLAYAPLQVMEQTSVLKEHLPQGTEIRWKNLSNTSAIREAMLAGEVNLGFMAIPPFLIGRQNGMPWKIATGLCESPSGLVSSSDSIRSLVDISDSDMIALPQPGSIQHILLSMAAKREFGDPSRFDNHLIAMSHPDGYAAMTAKGDIRLHFTTMPYLAQELENPSFHLILSGEEILGARFSFLIGACPESFYERSPDLYRGFLEALDETIAWMEENPKEAAMILSGIYGISEEDIAHQLSLMTFDTTVRGLYPIADFMAQAGFLERGKLEMNEMYFEGTSYE